MHTKKSVDYILINLFNITSIFENEISNICNNPFMILPHNCDLNNDVLAVGCMIVMHGGNVNSWYKKSMHNDNSCTFNTSHLSSWRAISVLLKFFQLVVYFILIMHRLRIYIMKSADGIQEE